eukprot:121677-Pyramimonas_sp.AAC.1
MKCILTYELFFWLRSGIGSVWSKMYVDAVEVLELRSKNFWNFTKNVNVWMHVHLELKVPASDDINLMSRVASGGPSNGNMKGILSEVPSTSSHYLLILISPSPNLNTEHQTPKHCPSLARKRPPSARITRKLRFTFSTVLIALYTPLRTIPPTLTQHPTSPPATPGIHLVAPAGTIRADTFGHR